MAVSRAFSNRKKILWRKVRFVRLKHRFDEWKRFAEKITRRSHSYWFTNRDLHFHFRSIFYLFIYLVLHSVEINIIPITCKKYIWIKFRFCLNAQCASIRSWKRGLNSKTRKFCKFFIEQILQKKNKCGSKFVSVFGWLLLFLLDEYSKAFWNSWNLMLKKKKKFNRPDFYRLFFFFF